MVTKLIIQIPVSMIRIISVATFPNAPPSFLFKSLFSLLLNTLLKTVFVQLHDGIDVRMDSINVDQKFVYVVMST